MAEKEIKIVKTGKSITLQVESKGCGDPKCTLCCRKDLKWCEVLVGEWMGMSGARPLQIEDQMLEMRNGYFGWDTPCRDSVVLLTYGQIKAIGMTGAVKSATHCLVGAEKRYQIVIEWFVQKVQRHFDNKQGKNKKE